MKKNYILNIVFVLLLSNLTAQTVCEEQLVANNGVNGSSIGQSIFMSECSGYFNSIELNRSDDGAEITAEFKIFIGQTFLGTPLYTQSVTIPEATGPFTLNFEGGDGSLAFFEASQYTFMLSNSDLQLEASSGVDSYSDGQLFVDVGFINNDDLWFKLYTTSTLGMDLYEIKKPSLFPNPAIDSIQLSGINGSQTFTIFNILGLHVMDGVVTTGQSINIQNFPEGMYFLKLNEHNAIKFIKK